MPLCDVAAFTFGKLFGRHKMRPNISPNKTWEGSFGAFLVGMALPWIFRFSLEGFGTRELLLAGLIVGVGSQLGDLSISVIKRDIGIKDMGALIEGHGGVLDRIDSLIYVAPLFFHMTRFFVGIRVMERRGTTSRPADFDKTPLEKLSTFPASAGHARLRRASGVARRASALGCASITASASSAASICRSTVRSRWWPITPATSTRVTLLSALPLTRIQHAYPAAAKDYFFTSMPTIAFSAVVMNAMPFDRKENPRESLALCRELLETPGHVLILFPEGTRTTTGELGRRSSPASDSSPPARTSPSCRAISKAATAPGPKARSSRARAN